LTLAGAIPGLSEAFTLGLSHLDDDESHLADDWELAHVDQISRILWGRAAGELKRHSDLEDVADLHTHVRHGRDVFVTTDDRMLARRSELADLGIVVATPDQALRQARGICERRASA
jgi:hypothetical protein